ncbi:hypothetical protein [Stackebrandtia soli]|uniref:hypothetical protein n=1 Tax=Stackebrandtia soli TaxID=1892856 RepID=UPI0039E7AB78
MTAINNTSDVPAPSGQAPTTEPATVQRRGRRPAGHDVDDMAAETAAPNRRQTTKLVTPKRIVIVGVLAGIAAMAMTQAGVPWPVVLLVVSAGIATVVLLGWARSLRTTKNHRRNNNHRPNGPAGPSGPGAGPGGGRPQGPGGGKPNGGKPNGRPQVPNGGKPNGKPQGPNGKPNGGKPNGKPQGPGGGKPNGQPPGPGGGKPNGGKPNGRPQVPNGTKPNGGRPNGKPNGKPNGPQVPHGGKPNGMPSVPNGKPNGKTPKAPKAPKVPGSKDRKPLREKVRTAAGKAKTFGRGTAKAGKAFGRGTATAAKGTAKGARGAGFVVGVGAVGAAKVAGMGWRGTRSAGAWVASKARFFATGTDRRPGEDRPDWSDGTSDFYFIDPVTGLRPDGTRVPPSEYEQRRRAEALADITAAATKVNDTLRDTGTRPADTGHTVNTAAPRRPERRAWIPLSTDARLQPTPPPPSAPSSVASESIPRQAIPLPATASPTSTTSSGGPMHVATQPTVEAATGMAAYRPRNLLDIVNIAYSSPDALRAIAMAFDRLGAASADSPAGGAVAEKFRDVAARLRSAASAATEIAATVEVECKHDLERIRNPRPNEHMADVTANQS